MGARHLEPVLRQDDVARRQTKSAEELVLDLPGQRVLRRPREQSIRDRVDGSEQHVANLYGGQLAALGNCGIPHADPSGIEGHMDVVRQEHRKRPASAISRNLAACRLPHRMGRFETRQASGSSHRGCSVVRLHAEPTCRDIREPRTQCVDGRGCCRSRRRDGLERQRPAEVTGCGGNAGGTCGRLLRGLLSSRRGRTDDLRFQAGGTALPARCRRSFQAGGQALAGCCRRSPLN